VLTCCYLQERTNVFWAPGSSTIVGKVQKRLGALVLEEAPLTPLSDQQAWPIWNKVCVSPVLRATVV
jgi:hypothetical protein